MRKPLCAVVVVLLTAIPVWAGETVDAVWVEHEVEFTLLGIEVAYSCDIAEAKITSLLRHLGAADIDVRTSPCPGFDRPQQRIPMVAKFSTLASATDGDIDVVKAAWNEVELGKRRPSSIDDGDCELLEHFLKYLLPAFEHEVVEGTTGCSAARTSVVGRQKLKVLESVTSKK